MSVTPYHQQHLQLDDGHALYVAQYGKHDGRASVVLHGGPGSGCQPSMLEWFDLRSQRVVLFDQRGAGKSLPHGELVNNDSHRLVADIETLRTALGITRWSVVGGSWGATLALLYAGKHTSHIDSLILRGSFLSSAREMDWFFQGLKSMVPVAWDALTAGWSTQQKQQVLPTLCQMLLRGSVEAANDAARRWSQYEDSIMRVMGGTAMMAPATDEPVTARTLGKYRLQAHYLSQGCFTSERQLFRMARQLRQVPAILIHGSHDLVCPPENALRLHRFMPHAQLRWVMKGSHTPADPLIAQALNEAVAEFKMA